MVVVLCFNVVFCGFIALYTDMSTWPNLLFKTVATMLVLANFYLIFA
jgi:hypothetical protein